MSNKRRSHGEGSVTARGKNKWRLRYDGPIGADGKRNQVSETVRGTKSNALETLRERIRSIDTGLYVERQTQTVAEYLNWWLGVHKNNIAPATAQSYSSIVRQYLAPSIGGVELQRLEPNQIQSLYSDIADRGLKCGPHIHRVLRKALNDALRLGMIVKNPAVSVLAPKLRKSEIKAWDAREFNKFLGAANNSEFCDFFEFSVHTGMRRSEITGLRWKNVDLTAGIVRVVETLKRVSGQGLVIGAPKTERASRRSIVLGNTAIQLLKRVRVEQSENLLAMGSIYEDRGYVFTDGLGNPRDADQATKEFKRIVRSINLPDVTLHSLRHTHASLLIEQGTHVKVLSERLGHASVAFTMDTYAHLLPGLQQQAADAIDRSLASG